MYTPTTGYSGQDSFTYTITDTNGASATATIHVTVTPSKRLAIMPLGDSITVGTTLGNLSPEQGYRGPLADGLTSAGIAFQYQGSNAPGVYAPYDADAMAAEGHSGYTDQQYCQQFDR